MSSTRLARGYTRVCCLLHSWQVRRRSVFCEVLTRIFHWDWGRLLYLPRFPWPLRCRLARRVPALNPLPLRPPPSIFTVCTVCFRQVRQYVRICPGNFTVITTNRARVKRNLKRFLFLPFLKLYDVIVKSTITRWRHGTRHKAKI